MSQHSPSSPMKRLFRYLGQYRSSLWLAILFSIINKIFDLMPPFLTAWMIDTASGTPPNWSTQLMGTTNSWHIIIGFAVLTFLIFGFESFFEWLFQKGFMRLAQRVQHDLRLETYSKLQAKEMGYFEDQRTGNLLSILNDDVNQLERFLNTSFNEIIQLITLVIFAGWSLIYVSPLLGLIGMAPIPFIILGSLYYQRKIGPYYKAIRQGVGVLSNRLENNISGIQVIKSFSTEKFEQARVKEASLVYRDANYKAIRWSAVYVPLIRMFIAVGFTATLLIGSYWVIYEPEKFSLGSLAFFAMMTQRLLWPVTRLGTVFDAYERAKASARRIFELLDAPTAIKDAEQPATLPSQVGAIEFKSVSFAYKNGVQVLEQMDFSIPAGRRIGIAGATGGGKTTLIKLLLRFYDVTGGAILLNGIDIREIKLHDLRQQIALVSQEVYLFHGTIRENIAYGMTEVDLSAIQQAAQKAQIHEFIADLPDGYETIIGERGIKLSGGQRQRISIARAILKDAPILVLDEATSAVDTETERAIQQNLDLLTQNKTAIIVAHRLSTIRSLDEILVVQAGKLIEQGSHEELLDQKGIYADLWNIQLGIVSAQRIEPTDL